MLRSVSTRIAGLCIIIAGIWGGIIPFVGPYFHFTLGPDQAWTWTGLRLYMDVLPAAAAVLGGLMLLGAGPWAAGRIGALLALAAGIWFAVGPDLSALWHAGGAAGAAHGTIKVQMLERLGLHTGVGVVIAALAGYALPGAFGRRAARTATMAEGTAGTAAAAPAAEGAPVAEGAPAAEGAPTEQVRRPITGRDRIGV
jgi:hypothetical protein